MALHAPTHHAGLHNDRLLRDAALAVVLAIILVATFGLAMSVKVNVGPTGDVSAEQQALVEYRAGERADWAAGIPTQASSLAQFRAGERADWATGVSSEASSLIEFRASERSGK
jgi:hypothetical protein